MVYLMGMQSKELHKLCGRLREDRFLAVYVTSPCHVQYACGQLIDFIS
jgi:hypothetical protein